MLAGNCVARVGFAPARAMQPPPHGPRGQVKARSAVPLYVYVLLVALTSRGSGGVGLAPWKEQGKKLRKNTNE